MNANQKEAMKKAAIARYIDNVAGSWPAFSYGKIPSSRARNACSTYAGAVRVEDIYGLVDTSAFANGKTGLIFTSRAVYYNNGLFGSSGKITYERIYESQQIDGGIFSVSYNKQALIELLSLLASIEGETGTLKQLGMKLDSINKTVNELGGTVGQLGDVVNSVVEVANGISSLWSALTGENNQKKQ